MRQLLLILPLLVVAVGCGSSAQTSATDEKMLHAKLGAPPNGHRRGAGARHREQLLNATGANAASGTTGTPTATPPAGATPPATAG